MSGKSRSDKLLILDLDETLISAVELVDGKLPPGRDREDLRLEGHSLIMRPGLARFMDFAFSTFGGVAFWTVATADYAADIVSTIVGDRTPVFVRSRLDCTRRYDRDMQEFYFIKDLGKLAKRHDLNGVIMVDDTPRALMRNFGNLVRVKKYAGEEIDDELALLETYLAWLVEQPNVRSVEKRGWRDGTISGSYGLPPKTDP